MRGRRLWTRAEKGARTGRKVRADMASNDEAKPWVAEGISRRVWYHRRAQSRVPPASIATGNGQGKVRLLVREQIDGRSKARRRFDAIAQGIAEDLGGEHQLSTVQKHLVEAFAGCATHVHDLNARLLLGEQVDITAHASAISTMVRVASRIGMGRVARDVTPSLADIQREYDQP